MGKKLTKNEKNYLGWFALILLNLFCVAFCAAGVVAGIEKKSVELIITSSISTLCATTLFIGTVFEFIDIVKRL